MSDGDFNRLLGEWAAREPFRPFVVGLTGGATLVVDDPKALAVRLGVAAYLSADRQITLFDFKQLVGITEAG